MKLFKAALVSLFVSCLSAEAYCAVSVGARSSSSFSRPSMSASRPTVSTNRSYSKPISSQANKPRVVKTSTTRVNKKVEYDYYALNDCTRIIKPVNGYRCIDRD